MKGCQPSAVPWARAALGVDDTSGDPIVVRATRRLGRLRLERCPPGHPVALDSTGLAVAACLRQRESFIRWVDAPLASPRKALRVFPSLLDVQLPFSIEDCVYSFVDARPAAGGLASRGLAVGARSADVAKRLQAFPSALGSPHVLDQEGLALWTQARAEAPAGAADQPLVAVYESTDRLTLVIGRGDELLGAHTWRTFEPEPVNRALRLHFPAPPPALAWVWTGPAAAAAGVGAKHAALADRWPGTLVIPPEPEAFLARALATRALTAGRLRFNARQAGQAHPAEIERQRREPLRAAAACLAAGLVLCLVNGAWLTGTAQRQGRLQESLRQAAVRVAGSERLVPRGQERLGAERALEERSRLVAPLLAPFRTPVTGSLGTVLAAAQAEGLSVQSLTANRARVVLQATAPAWAHGERTAQRLQRQGWKTKVDRKGDGAGRLSLVILAEVPHGL